MPRSRRAALLALVLVTVVCFVLGGQGETRGVVRAQGQAVRFVQAFTDDDGVVADAALDGADTGIDPGTTGDVGRCTATVDGEGNATVALSNAYPGYACRLWLRASNEGEAPIAAAAPTLSSPAALALSATAPGWSALAPGESGWLVYRVAVGPDAAPDHTYSFSIEQGFVAAD